MKWGMILKKGAFMSKNALKLVGLASILVAQD